MSKFNLTHLLIVVLSISTAYAQQNPKKDPPKLVVSITIDQLRSDYLWQLMEGYGEKGFKRLLREGLVYGDVKFEFPTVSRAAGTATLFTGTQPFYHGIIADNVYDPKQKKEIPALYDPAFMGNFTSETLSPGKLQASTFADELKIATSGRSEIYAIAPDNQVALISAGHVANGAFWIDDLNGRWATTTFYKDVPWYVDRYNTQDGLPSRIRSMSWKNLKDPSFYTLFPYIINHNSGFQYTYNNYKAIKTSALVNEEVTKLAERFFEYSSLGKKDIPDFLALSYFAGIPDGSNVQEYAVELQDTYFRLDGELEKLLELIDKKIGLRNTVIILTSTGYFSGNEDREFINIRFGEFFPKRAVALLNMYLMAIYGQGNWVETYYDKQLFLNKKLIEEKQIPLEEIQRKSADFLVDLSGVQDVYTAYDLYHSRGNEQLNYIRNGYHRENSGDLLLEIKAGWKIMDEEAGTGTESVRKAHVMTPVIFFAPDIPARIIKPSVRATQIAPSICHILRIRPPNGAFDEVLTELK
ncbi:MAG: alkaline phosphatase family protein [Candidatus Azobacteroides sp.]|nr:alkaline phosphatase family protein [Candidatus Azobacteroides sp.]